MTSRQFCIFSDFRESFKSKINEWSKFNDQLIKLQFEASQNGGVPDYPIENPILYNSALDEISEKDEIKLILIGDNPGKNEQLNENKKYLVGLAGKLGVKFFAENPELSTDFRKNVIILNKTPVHSARTEHLKYIIKNGSPEICNLIKESQIWMAQATAKLHMDLNSENAGSCGLWLVGYSELKNKGLFLSYRDSLLETYKNSGKTDLFCNGVFTFQHFSMNRFSIDLNEFRNAHPDLPLTKSLSELGSLHRKEIFRV